MRKKISHQAPDSEESRNNKLVIYALIAMVGLFLLSGVYSIATMKPLKKGDLQVTEEQRKKMLENINIDGKTTEVNKVGPTLNLQQQDKLNGAGKPTLNENKKIESNPNILNAQPTLKP
jgi:hypothetical protein